MKEIDGRRLAGLILVFAACLPIPWWGKVPTLKMLSAVLIIAGLQLMRRRAAASITAEPDGRAKLKKSLALVAVTGALAAVAYAMLTHADSLGVARPWHLYFFAAAAGAFFWTLSGLLMRSFK